MFIFLFGLVESEPIGVIGEVESVGVVVEVLVSVLVVSTLGVSPILLVDVVVVVVVGFSLIILSFLNYMLDTNKQKVILP